MQLQPDGVSLSNLQRGLLLAALGGDQNGLKRTQESVTALRADMKKRFDEMDVLLADREEGRKLVADLCSTSAEFDATEAEIDRGTPMPPRRARGAGRCDEGDGGPA